MWLCQRSMLGDPDRCLHFQGVLNENYENKYNILVELFHSIILENI